MVNYERAIKKEDFLNTIISLLIKNKGMSIADIQRKTKSKRSTLIYYLNLLSEKGYIEKERIETKMIGRPTIIKLKKEKLKNVKSAERKKKQYAYKILKHIQDKGGKIGFKEFSILPGYNPNWIEDPERNNKSNANFYVSFSNLIKKEIKLTKEGGKFLEDNKNLN